MDTVDPLRFIFAFIFVIGLIGIGALLLRYSLKSSWAPRAIFFGKGMRATGDGGVGRLQVVEVRYLDPRRKLVLVRRDDVEHLLLIADGRELVIESRIATGMIPLQSPHLSDGPHA